MELSRHILKEFADVSRGVEREDKTQYLRGTIKGSGEAKYVRIDGSESLTPISEIVDVKDGDRVLVTIENHEATILGNLTMPPSAYKEQEAIDKAEDAQGTANDANEKAETAKTLAQSAGDKADAAVVDAGNASVAAEQAKQNAADAMTAAESANANSTEAKDLATAAGQNAETARQEAAAANSAATAAQQKVSDIQVTIGTVQGNIDTALDDLAKQAEESEAIKETMRVEYAKKNELELTEASLETEISKRVGELKDTISEKYMSKTDGVSIEGALESQRTQTQGLISSTVSKFELLESDTSEADKLVDIALEKAANAKIAATEAKNVANVAQQLADTAKSEASVADARVEQANQNATEAEHLALQADAKLASAKTDLDEAQKNYTSVKNNPVSTKEQIEEARKKVEAADAAVTKALEDAAEARVAANNARDAANIAQNNANEAQDHAKRAQIKADNALVAANNAQENADRAQEDVASLNKLTSWKSSIDQSAENIKLAVEGVTTVGKRLDNLNVGGENLFRDAGFRKKELALSAPESYIPGAWIAYNNNSSYEFGEYDNLVNYLQFTSMDRGNLGVTQFYDKEILQPGKEFRIRFYTMCETADYNISVLINKKSSSGSFNWYFLQPYEKTIQKSSDFIEHKVEFTIPKDDDGVMYGVTLINKGNSTSNGHTIKMVKPKLEDGNTYTDFSISTKDMATQEYLKNNFFTKEETTSAINLSAQGVTTTVTTTLTKEITNINIGGENLFLDSAFRKKEFKDTNSIFYVPGHWVKYNDKEFTFSKYEGIINETSFASEQGINNGIVQFFENNTLQPGKEYRIRFFAKSSVANSIIKIHFVTKDSSGNFNWYSDTLYEGTIKKANEYTEIKAELKIPENDKSQMYGISLINYGTNETNGATITFVKPKFEVGNRYTDFSQSGKDLATGDAVDQAQNTANEANGKADATEQRVTTAESTLTHLANQISMLVTDDNGSSMMTQTSDGWTFNIGAIKEKLNTATENLDDLTKSHAETQNIVKNLNELANDLIEKTAYINMMTDETGAPCIELGKTGNNFKLRITNSSVDFIDGTTKVAYVSNQVLYIERTIIKDEMQIGEGTGFIWKRRSNGNLGLRWAKIPRVYVTSYKYTQDLINKYSASGYTGTWNILESSNTTGVAVGDKIKLGMLNTSTGIFNYVEATVNTVYSKSLNTTSTGIVTTS